MQIHFQASHFYHCYLQPNDCFYVETLDHHPTYCVLKCYLFSCLVMYNGSVTKWWFWYFLVPPKRGLFSIKVALWLPANSLIINSPHTGSWLKPKLFLSLYSDIPGHIWRVVGMTWHTLVGQCFFGTETSDCHNKKRESPWIGTE